VTAGLQIPSSQKMPQDGLAISEMLLQRTMKKLAIQARDENIFWGERNNFDDETSLDGTNCRCGICSCSCPWVRTIGRPEPKPE
jgi:hypothetical protein